MNQNVDYIVDAIIVLICLGICCLLYWIYFLLFVQPELKKTKAQILRLIQDKRYKNADFLLFCAVKKWPKNKIFRKLKDKYESQINFDLGRSNEDSLTIDDDFYENLKKEISGGLSIKELNKIQNLVKMQGDHKNRKNHLITDIISILLSIWLTVNNTIYYPRYFHWVNLCPFVYLFAVELLIGAFYLLKSLNKESENYTLYHSLLGLYLTVWAFSFAFSFASQLPVIAILFLVIFLASDISLIVWMYRRRITVFQRKETLPAISPILNFLLLFAEILILGSAYVITLFLNRQIVFVALYFLIIEIIVSLQLLNFADFYYLRKRQKYQDEINLIQLYKNSRDRI